MAGDTKIVLLSISYKGFLSGYGFRVALVTPRVPLGGQLAFPPDFASWRGGSEAAD